MLRSYRHHTTMLYVHKTTLVTYNEPIQLNTTNSNVVFRTSAEVIHTIATQVIQRFEFSTPRLQLCFDPNSGHYHILMHLDSSMRGDYSDNLTVCAATCLGWQSLTPENNHESVFEHVGHHCNSVTLLLLSRACGCSSVPFKTQGG